MHKWTKPPKAGDILVINPNGSRQSNPEDTNYTAAKVWKKVIVTSVLWEPDTGFSTVYFTDLLKQKQSNRWLDRFSPSNSGKIKINTRRKY